MIFKENISLKPYNTFGVDAVARYFATIRDEEMLKEAINEARSLPTDRPILFLGGGSNVLFTKDYEGAVILLRQTGIREEVIDENRVRVTAAAGENWHTLVEYCLRRDFGGLENLSLIPGNAGTSPVQNIGAYGVEVKDVLENCKALDIRTLEANVFNNESCAFGYRDSFFKGEGRGHYVITEVSFRLTTMHHQLKTEYGAIKSQLEKLSKKNPTIQDVSKAVLAIRREKLPDPSVLGNAGSFFKNPVINQSVFQQIKSKFPDVPGYPSGDSVKLPAAWLIEKAGWKGRRIGSVATHPVQPLVIINASGDATGREIFEFSAEIIADVQAQFGVLLEREVNVL